MTSKPLPPPAGLDDWPPNEPVGGLPASAALVLVETFSDGPGLPLRLSVDPAYQRIIEAARRAVCPRLRLVHPAAEASQP